jgi:hypothetical protein
MKGLFNHPGDFFRLAARLRIMGDWVHGHLINGSRETGLQ